MLEGHGDAGPLLVCRCTYVLRVLLAGTLGPVFYFSLVPAWGGNTGGLISALISGGLLGYVWLADAKKEARIFRDRVELDTLFGHSSVALGSATEYRYLVKKSYLFFIPVGTDYQIAIDDGENRLMLRRLRRLGEATELLRRAELEDVLPGAIRRAEQGAPMSFGPLALKGDRIQYRGEEVAVSELSAVNAKSTVVELWLPEERLPWAYEGTQSVPNLATFLELVRRGMAKQARP